MKRIETGISELDKILDGFPVGKTVIVTGDPGTGKTIFGLQFANISCVKGLKTVYISAEENARDLRMQGESFGWDFEDFEQKGVLEFVELVVDRAIEIETAMSLYPNDIKRNFVELLENLPKDTQVLIIDSLGGHAANLMTYEFKDRFDFLVYSLGHKNITAMVILESVLSKEFNELAVFSAYGAIKLMKKDNPYTGRRERVMDIVKMRNTKTPIQLITYDISSGGIVLPTPIEINRSP